MPLLGLNDNGEFYEVSPVDNESVGSYPHTVEDSSLIIHNPGDVYNAQYKQALKDKAQTNKILANAAKAEGLKQAQELLSQQMEAATLKRQQTGMTTAEKLAAQAVLNDQRSGIVDFDRYAVRDVSTDFGKMIQRGPGLSGTMGVSKADYNWQRTVGDPLTKDGDYGPVTDFEQFVNRQAEAGVRGSDPQGTTPDSIFQASSNSYLPVPTALGYARDAFNKGVLLGSPHPMTHFFPGFVPKLSRRAMNRGSFSGLGDGVEYEYDAELDSPDNNFDVGPPPEYPPDPNAAPSAGDYSAAPPPEIEAYDPELDSPDVAPTSSGPSFWDSFVTSAEKTAATAAPGALVSLLKPAPSAPSVAPKTVSMSPVSTSAPSTPVKIPGLNIQISKTMLYTGLATLVLGGGLYLAHKKGMLKVPRLRKAIA